MPPTRRSRRPASRSARSRPGREAEATRAQVMPSRAEHALDDLDAARRGFTAQRARFWILCAVVVAFYAVSWDLAGIDLHKLAVGLPKLGHWIATAWPPKLDGVPLFALRTPK